jgi:large subunit ribosomal protein L3
MVTEIKDLGVLGKKLGMTQVFDEEGDVVPVTVIQLADNIVTEIKTTARDGYSALQIGAYPAKSSKHLSKPERVNLEKKNIALFKSLKEFRSASDIDGLNVGDAINLEEFFKDLKKVSISGKSIGKGFQGAVKLHNIGVGRNSHGSKSKRQIGSLGAGTTPSNIKPGKRMPAMMGNRQVTIQKSKVFKYDPDKRLLLVRGPVPGKAGTELIIKAFGVRTWNHHNKQTAV